MRADSGGVGIEYEVTGVDRSVVLLHGFSDSGRLWRHQVRALADAGFKVIVPDMRGDGAPRTSRTTWRPTTCSSWSPMSRRWRRSPPERVDHLVTLSVGHPSTFRSDGFVRGHCRALAVRRRLGQLPPLGASSRRRCGHRRARGQRPRCRLPPLGVWSSGDIAHRGRDDALGGAGGGPLALRASRRPRPLDAARGSLGRQPVVGGIPARYLSRAASRQTSSSMRPCVRRHRRTWSQMAWGDCSSRPSTNSSNAPIPWWRSSPLRSTSPSV